MSSEEEGSERGKVKEGGGKEGGDEGGGGKEGGAEVAGGEKQGISENESMKVGKKRGRPSGKGKSQVDQLTESVSCPAPTRRRIANSSNLKPPETKIKTPATTPRQKNPCSTSTRPTYYLIGRPPTSLINSKLPKSGPVLGRLLLHMETQSLAIASEQVMKEVKAVWLQHFGPKLIEGKEYGKEDEKDTNQELKIVKSDQHVEGKIKELYKKWVDIERESRRPGRAEKSSFLEKQKALEDALENPFDIRRLDAEDRVKHSGMLDWREEVEYLRNQMAREQVGCPGSWDTRQRKRDDRRLNEERAREAKEKEVKEAKEKEEKTKYERDENEDEVGMDENKNDPTFKVKERQMKKNKIDVMGKISLTCDARNISKNDRTVVAASVANALGVNINQTNISSTTAWRKGQEVRSKKAREVKVGFRCPDKAVVHWDGKTLAVRGRLETKRVCVYLSAVEEGQVSYHLPPFTCHLSPVTGEEAARNP